MKTGMNYRNAIAALAVCVTVAFGAAPAPAQTPASPAPDAQVKVDPAAYALLKDAYEHREMFDTTFAGFTSDVTMNDNGTETTGKLTYTPGKSMTLTFDNMNVKSVQWVRDQLTNLIEHRRGGDFAKGDGRNPITFTTDHRSPLGRQVALNDGLQSLYRVRAHQIVEVTRTMGDVRFTITMLENTVTDNNRYVPHYFTVTGFDAKTGALVESESYSDAYAKFDGYWLPTMRRVISAENGGFTTRTVELRNIHCQRSATAAK